MNLMGEHDGRPLGTQARRWGGRRVMVATIVAAAVAWTACSRPDPGATVSAVSEDDAKAAFGSSVGATANARTVRMRITGSLTVDPPNGAGNCSLYPIVPGTTTIEVGVDRTAERFTIANADGTPRAIVDGTSTVNPPIYLAQSATPAAWGAARPWTLVPHLDPSEVALVSVSHFHAIEPLFSTLMGIGLLVPDSMHSRELFEPNTLLAGLRDQSQTVTALGEEDVDGQPTQHLRLTIDPAGAARSTGTTTYGAPPGTNLRSPPPAFTQVDAEAWVRPDGKVARLRVSVVGDDVGSFPSRILSTQPGSQFAATSDIHFGAYDEPLPLTLPAATDVQSFEELPAAAVLSGPSQFDDCMAAMTAGLGTGAETQVGPTPEEITAYVECQKAEQLQQMGTMTVGAWRRHLKENSPPSGPLVNVPGAFGSSSACAMPWFPPPTMSDFGPGSPPSLSPLSPPEEAAMVACAKAMVEQAQAPPTDPGTTSVPTSFPSECEGIFPEDLKDLLPPHAFLPTPDDPAFAACTEAITKQFEQSSPGATFPPVESLPACQGVFPGLP